MESSQAVNFWAVATAAISAFLLGGVWYSPLLFGKAWMRQAGLSEEALRKGNPALTFGLSFLLSLVGALVFALFLGPRPALGFAVGAGLMAGLCWVAGSLGINYLFEHKSFKLFVINGGYHTLQYTLFGLVLGLWH